MDIHDCIMDMHKSILDIIEFWVYIVEDAMISICSQGYP